MSPDELAAVAGLVRKAREQGVAVTGPGGLVKALTKTVIETAREEEITDHLGLRPTAAMRFLHAGIDTSVIALWLGDEQIATTGIYLHADLAMKQQALDRTHPPDLPAGRYQPDDALLTWLTNL